MAALLSVFHPVPPVIRRRAKELLDTIRDAVKGALGSGSAAENSAEADTTTTNTEAEAEARMSIDDTPAAVVASTSIVSSASSDSLWANG